MTVTPATGERRIALVLVALFVVADAAVLPLATRRVGMDGDVFVSAITTTSFVAMLTTAAILRFRYRIAHHAPLAYLALSFGFGGCAALLSLAGAGKTTWSWLAWQVFFIAFLGATIAAERGAGSRPTRAQRHGIRRAVTWSAIGSLAIAIAARIAQPRLPALIAGGAYTPLFHVLAGALVIAPAALLAAELALRTRLRRSDDVWIAAVLALMCSETLIAVELGSGPFSLGWFVGRLEGAAVALIMLAVQMRALFARLRRFATLNRELADVAEHDALTGLLNRRAFDERFETLWRQCRRLREPLSLVLVDVDYFKRYNDHFGHVAGDDALRRFGLGLAAVVKRPADIVCRIGGEEFGLVLPFTDAAGAGVVADRIVVRVRELGIAHAPGLPVSVLTASVGVATAAPPTNARRGLHEQADGALYHAKRSGRDRVGIALPGSRSDLRAG